MIVQARSIAFFESPAMTKRIDLIQRIYKRIKRRRIGIRSEIYRAVVKNIPRFEKARKFLAGYAQNRIRFSVLKVDVVFWRIFLNQIVFQQERLVFVRSGNVFYGRGIGNQKTSLDVFFP